jgi:methionyl-tRNA formyltransferase
MVIVFFGTPQFAVPSLERLVASTHEVRAVVTQPDRPRGRGQKVVDAPVKAAARQHGIPVFQPARLRDPAVTDAVAGWAPDLGVVVAYGKLIPPELLRIPRFGMINVHASLLPKYRGASPVHRAIIDGERETGVTIMRVVDELDAGAMLAKATQSIGDHETSEAVERDLSVLGANLLIDVVDRIESGTVVDEEQDHAASTYAPRLRKEEGLIDWTLPAARVHNLVRGLYPWPHAYSYLDGSRLIILKTHPVDSPAAGEPRGTPRRGSGESEGTPPRRSGEPGEVVDVSRDAIHVATGGGILAIDELQAEGRRPVAAREFLAGRPVRPGSRFTSP